MKKKLIIIFALFFFLYPTISVFACIPTRPWVAVECDIREDILQADRICLDKNCDLEARKYDHPSIQRYNLYYKESFSGKIENGVVSSPTWPSTQLFSLIEKVCVDNFESIMPAFKAAYKTWDKNYTDFLDANLVFTYNKPEKIAKLTKHNKNLLKCDYLKAEPLDNWLVISQVPRNYCYEVETLLGTCSSSHLVLSPVAFMWYITINLGKQTWPYWLGIICFLSLIFYLKTKDLLHTIFQPNLSVIILLILIIVYCFVTMYPRLDIMLSWIAIDYLVVSLLLYGLKLIMGEKRKRHVTKS